MAKRISQEALAAGVGTHLSRLYSGVRDIRSRGLNPSLLSLEKATEGTGIQGISFYTPVGKFEFSRNPQASHIPGQRRITVEAIEGEATEIDIRIPIVGRRKNYSINVWKYNPSSTETTVSDHHRDSRKALGIMKRISDFISQPLIDISQFAQIRFSTLINSGRANIPESVIGSITKPQVFTVNNSYRLARGYIIRKLDSIKNEIEIKSLARSVCDVALLITYRPDGSAFVTMTHFLPTVESREASKTVIDEMSKIHPKGARFTAVVVTRDSNEKTASYEEVVKSLTLFSNGQTPDIIHTSEAVACSEIKGQKEFDKYQMVYTNSFGRHTITVPGTSYKRSFADMRDFTKIIDNPIELFVR